MKKSKGKPENKVSKKAEKRKEKEKAAKEAAFNYFSRYYLKQYSPDRWATLIESLRKPTRYCALGNKWAERSKLISLLGVDKGETVEYRSNEFGNVFVRKEKDCDEKFVDISSVDIEEGAEEYAPSLWPHPSHVESLDSFGISCYYPLDAASLLPVILLDVKPSSRVLDMCSAPGGKALAILQSLDLSGHLVCNDISPARRLRLRNVLRKYMPMPMFENIEIIGVDATNKKNTEEYCECFDRVLVDAPCSSERHVLHNPDELAIWSMGRSKTNAERQVLLLLAALRCCKVGGRVVYSTCSLSNLENDGVIEKCLRKSKGKMNGRIVVRGLNSDAMPFGEATTYGWHILPDKSEGWGPIYLCILDKIESDKSLSSVFREPSDVNNEDADENDDFDDNDFSNDSHYEDRNDIDDNDSEQES